MSARNYSWMEGGQALSILVGMGGATYVQLPVHEIDKPQKENGAAAV